MQLLSPNDMSIVERVSAPCPPFFKKLRNIGLILGGVATTILTGGVALPAVVTTIAGYLATASAVAVVVSQCTVDLNASFDVK
jgi:hypothetical protein